jgi:hypothetical protein
MGSRETSEFSKGDLTQFKILSFLDEKEFEICLL